MPRPWDQQSGETPWLQLSSSSATRHRSWPWARVSASGRRPRSASRPHRQRRRSKSCDSSSLSRSGCSRSRAGRSRISAGSWTRRAPSHWRHATSWRSCARSRPRRSVPAAVGGAPGPDGAGRPPVPRARGAGGDRGRVPGIDAHPGQRRGPADRGTRAHDGRQQLRRHRHGRQVRHLLDPGRGDRGRPPGRAHDLRGPAQPLQLRPAHADGSRRHARVRRGRLRRDRQRVPAPPRLRPVEEAHGRSDVVDLLRPRSRARSGSTARA